MCFLLIKVIKTTKVVLMHIFVTHLSLFNSQSCECFSLYKVSMQRCYFYTSDRTLTLSNRGNSHTLHSFKPIQNQIYIFTSRLQTVTGLTGLHLAWQIYRSVGRGLLTSKSNKGSLSSSLTYVLFTVSGDQFVSFVLTIDG